MSALSQIWESHPGVRFLAVGGSCAALYFLIWLALAGLGASPFVATVVAYFICFWIGYAAQRQIAFRSKRRHSIAMVRYWIGHLCGAIAVSVVTAVASTTLDLPAPVAAAIATVFGGIASYFISSRWVFGHRPV